MFTGEVKGNAQFFQLVTFEPLIYFTQNKKLEIENFTEAATFLKFSSLKL